MSEVKMHKPDNDGSSKAPGRRQFLTGMAAAGGAAAVVVATGDVAAESAEPVAPAAESRLGYHETAHIREYYKVASL